MRGIVFVGAKDLAGADHVDGHVTAEQGAHLNRRGLGAQQFAVGRRIDEQRVGQAAGRMHLRHVQRVEVQPFRFEFGPLDDLPTHRDEDIRHVVQQRGHRMQCADRMQVDRQRHVDPLGQQRRLEFGRIHLSLPGGQRLIHPPTGLTDQLAGVLSLARLECPDGAVRQRQRRLLARMVDAHLLELRAGLGGGDGVQCRVDQAEHVLGVEWVGLTICDG